MEGINFPSILLLRENPKFVVVDDPEVIRHLIPERFPLVVDGFTKEL